MKQNHVSGPESFIVPKEIFCSADQHSSKESERGSAGRKNVLTFAWANELLHLFFFVNPESVLLVCQRLMGHHKSYSVSLPDNLFPIL